MSKTEKGAFRERFFAWRARNLSTHSYMIVLSLLAGTAAGVSAWLLKTLVYYVQEASSQVEQFAFDYHMLILPAIGIGLTLLFRWQVLRDMVSHNITSLLEAISIRNSRIKSHKVFSSIIGGAFTAGFGGSVGLESPIISSGSAIGSSLGRYLRLNYKQITLLLACGAAGGIAAIFHTPIAGIVFALEVLMLDLTRFSLIPLLMASASGAITTRLLLKEEILFHFIPIDPFAVPDLPYYVVLGLLAGFLSSYFSRAYLFIDNKLNRIRKMRYRFAIGAGIVGVLVFLFPALRGEGYASIKHILAGQPQMLMEGSPFSYLSDQFWVFILFFVMLIVLKVVATSATVNAGGVGGIFAPSAFTGAAFGFLFVLLIGQLGLSNSLSASNFTLVGMASLLSGVLHAPLTALFLITEITAGYQLIVPLMISGAISYLVSKYLSPNSIITHQLAKRGRLITHHKDKAVLKFMQLRSVIEKDLSMVPYSAKLADLVEIIAHSKRSIFPVLDESGILMGVVHLDNVREIMFDKSLYESTKVSELMIRPEAQVMEKDTMEDVVRKFNETGAWNLPVTREDGYYLGHISKSKLFEEYRKRLVNISSE